ncbi:MAG: serine hydrolase [Pseudomonadota bacterium]
MSRTFELTRGLMGRAVLEGVFPGAVLLVAKAGRVLFHEAFGMRRLLPEPLPAHEGTVFDLASLTKPLATALSCGVFLAGQRRLSFRLPLAEFFPDAPRPLASVTLAQLLSHVSGLPALRNYFHRLVAAPEGERRGVLVELALQEPLVAAPGTVACYSDLGYILLGAVLEKTSGLGLDDLAARLLYEPLGLGLHFRPTGGQAPAVELAATEQCPLRGRVLEGEVHDENCWAAGGVCGHAGLFGTAAEVAALLLHLRAVVRDGAEGPVAPGTLRRMMARRRLPRLTTWGLGFDHPNKVGSSAGRYFSRRSVGHLGFTGCSFWMDLSDNDLLVVLLTNRVHPSRHHEGIKGFRPRLHEAVFKEATV